MRILLILIIIAAGVIVWQAHKHNCKYDATILQCAFGSGTAPTAETPPPPPPPPAEPAPSAAPETPPPAAPAQ
jgi:hypothetical protein